MDYKEPCTKASNQDPTTCVEYMFILVIEALDKPREFMWGYCFIRRKRLFCFRFYCCWGRVDARGLLTRYIQATPHHLA